MFAIANGRKALWQWDLNQQLTVAGDCTEVHYLDRGAPSTLTVAVKDGKADIPNILLQKAGRLVVYAYIIDAQDHHTKVCETFGIAPRPKPAEYVYTETEVKTWSDLQSQIGDLADLVTEEKNNLVAAINEAAQSGGRGAGAWYVTLTPDDDGNITANKTMAEIEAAYQAGYAVYCIYLYFMITAAVPIIAPLTIHRENTQYTFCGVGTMDKLYSFQFELTESGWTLLQKEIPQGTIPEVVASVSSSSTNAQVPSAKCVYDELQKRSLKQATSDTLGGVKADPATKSDTQPVRIGEDGKLVTAAGGTDTTLTQSGKAADAKAVGDALAEKADIPDIPATLPNPNALTFTGAVNATYDGSTAVSVEIPSGGSGGTDISLGLTSAAVGQIIKVKAIDESGKPTAWEAADISAGGGWELITDVTLTEDGGGAGNLNVTKNDKGEDFEYRQCMVCLSGKVIDGWPKGAYQKIYLYENNNATGINASIYLTRLAAGEGGTDYKTTVEMSIFGNLVRLIACGGSFDTSSLIIRNDTSIDTFRSIKLSCYGNNQGVVVPLAAGGRVVIYGRK